MSTAARRHYEESFLPRINALAKEVSEKPLVVLVWGPGPTGGELYEKRLQIRRLLREDGETAVFSEEIPNPVGSQYHQQALECIQALEADLIVSCKLKRLQGVSERSTILQGSRKSRGRCWCFSTSD